VKEHQESNSTGTSFLVDTPKLVPLAVVWESR